MYSYKASVIFYYPVHNYVDLVCLFCIQYYYMFLLSTSTIIRQGIGMPLDRSWVSPSPLLVVVKKRKVFVSAMN